MNRTEEKAADVKADNTTATAIELTSGTIPAGTSMFTDSGKTSALTSVDITGKLQEDIKTTGSGDSVTFDISYNYVKSDSTTTAIHGFSTALEHKFQLSKGLATVTVKHSGTLMTKNDDIATLGDGEYNYNSGTGVLTIKSSTYSAFEVTYTYNFVAATGGQGYTTLEEAFTAAKDRALITVLKDITLTGVWTPIETFKGTLDGNGHTISGLTVSGKDYVGLIGVLDGGTVKNLKFANVTATGGENVGAVVGRIINNGKVENVHVLSGTVTGSKRAGGIVGSIKA